MLRSGENLRAFTSARIANSDAGVVVTAVAAGMNLEGSRRIFSDLNANLDIKDMVRRSPFKAEG